MRSLCLLSRICIALVPMLACSVGQAGSDSLGTSVGPAESGESSDTEGDGDGDPAGDGDGDATGDGDGDASTGDGDGDATGDGDGDGSGGDGDGEGDNLTDDYRYTYSLESGSWSKIALTSVWNNPNAPLETEVVAATRLTHMPWLLLVGADGYLYQRHGNTWQPRVLVAEHFPLVADLDLGAIYHVPSASDPEVESLTFTDNPDSIVYELNLNGGVEYITSVVNEDLPPPAAPQGTGRTLWNFENAALELVGEPEWWVGWYGYDDGFVYRFDASFTWSRSPIDNNPFFGTGDVDEPDPTLVRAAWFERGQGEDHYLYMVGP